MSYLELKYIHLLGSRLRNFRQKGDIFNCSCAICGDSKRDKRKARGYILNNRGTGYYYYCHHCNMSLSLSNFLKEVANDLYEQYRLERLKDEKMETATVLEKTTFEKPKFLDYGALKVLKTVSQLSPDHPIKKFVIHRKIPNEYHSKLFAAPNFMSWVNGVIPGKFDMKALKSDGPRLVIPFFDKNKKCHAFQGRSVRPNGAKYISISLNKNEHMLYGRDTVDTSRSTIYVLEGPIDSMFIPNSVAVGSSYLPAAATLLPKDKLVLVFDNEPRNQEVIQVMAKAISIGFKVVIFPDTFKHKDINEAIIAGMEPSDILKIINDYTFKGLAAVLALKNWERI